MSEGGGHPTTGSSFSTAEPELAAFYFPSWHRDRRNDSWKHPGFTEWELVRDARPRFDGHRQPLVPQWGYFDESEPAVMSRSCAVAAEHGLSAFLFDWYWYQDEDFLNGALDRGYLAMARHPLRFALHWANHDWRDVFPATPGTDATFLAPARVGPAEFQALTDDLIRRYLRHPAYWRVRGGAYFSWHEFGPFVDWMGGWEGAREALADFRGRARSAGAGELHLVCAGGGPPEYLERLADVGIDSVTPYNWLHVLPLDQGLEIPYQQWRTLAERDRERYAGSLPIDYAPNVTMGWDSTARVAQDAELVVSTWPHLPVVVDNDAERFGQAVAAALAWARRHGSPYVSLNAWNEWTEGSYLEPEEGTGMSFLHAMRDAVAAGATQ